MPSRSAVALAHNSGMVKYETPPVLPSMGGDTGLAEVKCFIMKTHLNPPCEGGLTDIAVMWVCVFNGYYSMDSESPPSQGGLGWVFTLSV